MVKGTIRKSNESIRFKGKNIINIIEKTSLLSNEEYPILTSLDKRIIVLVKNYKKSSGFEKDKILMNLRTLVKDKEELRKSVAKMINVNPILLGK